MKTKSIILTAISAMLLAVLGSCGGTGGFEIDLTVEGQGTRGLEMVILDSKGIHVSELHPVDGNVKAGGSSSEPALVEFYQIGGGAPLLSLVTRNGDELKVSLDPAKGPASLEISGDKAMEAYAAWMRANADAITRGRAGAVNDSVAAFVSANPDSPASALLMATRYHSAADPVRADSLFSLIAPSARPSGIVSSFSAGIGPQVATKAREPLRSFYCPVGRDSVMRFNSYRRAYSILAFTDSRKPDSTLAAMRALARDMRANKARRAELLEISFARDSATWRGNISADSARWQQAWVAGGPGATQFRRFNIPATPFYLLVDSTGAQLYRGSSLATVERRLRELMALARTEGPDTFTPSPAAAPVNSGTERITPAADDMQRGQVTLKRVKR